jgi:malonyl-CoA O-methyltransferase
MEERLQWIVAKPRHWVHWEPLRGGLQAHGLLQKRYPEAQCHAVNDTQHHDALVRKALEVPWWSRARWSQKVLHVGEPRHPVQMLWANMALHMAADPQALMARWHAMLDIDGFLMFSCLGPDTVHQLRRLYAAAGWPSPGHQFTDMHDWGDMLVRAGFAEPVMDMEHITLTYTSPQALLEELRGIGRNLHPSRFPALRGRGWKAQLEARLAKELRVDANNGRLELTFEINYGHAFKPVPKLSIRNETSLTLEEMRRTLKQTKTGASGFSSSPPKLT